MKRKALFVLTVGMFVMFCLGGCSLAIENAGTTSRDRLIGIFVTDYYLDLTDLHGNEEKIYATIDKNGSSDFGEWNISFDGIEGEYFIFPLWENEEGETCRDSRKSAAVCDSKMNAGYGDDGENIQVSFTLYVQPGQLNQDCANYANPVYQTESGEIYLLSGQGSTTDDRIGEGEVYENTISDQVEITEGWKTKTMKTSVEISYNVMYRPTKIVLCQMDENHQLIKQDEYDPGKLPERLRAEKNTSYYIVETIKADSDGKQHIMREIYAPTDDEDEGMETFYPLENGLLTKQSTEIIWNK